MSNWTWKLERQQGRWTQKVTSRFMRGTKLGHKDEHPCSTLPYFPDFICYFSHSFYSSTTAPCCFFRLLHCLILWLGNLFTGIHTAYSSHPSQLCSNITFSMNCNRSPHSHTFDYLALLYSVYITLSRNILSLVILNVHFYVPFLEYKFYKGRTYFYWCVLIV